MCWNLTAQRTEVARTILWASAGPLFSGYYHASGYKRRLLRSAALRNCKRHINILAVWLASLTHLLAALTFRCPYDSITALGSFGRPQFWPFRRNFSRSIGLGTSPGGLCRNSRMPWCVFLGFVCSRRSRLRAAAAPTRWIWRPRRDRQMCAPAIPCNSRLLLMEWQQAQ